MLNVVITDRRSKPKNVQITCKLRFPFLQPPVIQRDTRARGTPGKRVTGKTGSQVRILFSPRSKRKGFKAPR